MPHLPPNALALADAMAGVFADRHISEALIPQLSAACKSPVVGLDAVRVAFQDPYHFLRAYYGHYAFAKRGRDRAALSNLATAALDRASDRERFLAAAQSSTPTDVWGAFSSISAEHGRAENSQLNQASLQSMATLVVETFAAHGKSVPSWIADQVTATGRAEHLHERIVSHKGIGPKAASILLRDIVFLFQLESHLHPMDRFLALPVDKWVRECAKLVIPEATDRNLADWLIAGKMARFTRQANVSIALFSMGLTWFGQNHVTEKVSFQDAVERRLSC